VADGSFTSFKMRIEKEITDHGQTKGKTEGYHRSMKNVVIPEHDYCAVRCFCLTVHACHAPAGMEKKPELVWLNMPLRYASSPDRCL